MDAGVNHRLSQLCELQLGSRQKPSVAQPKLSRQQKKQKLWRKSWNIMFTFLNGPHRKRGAHKRRSSSLSEVDQLHALAYDLRMLRKFDAANSLEDAVQTLSEVPGGMSDSLQRVLRLLVTLSDVKQEDKNMIVGHVPLHLPTVFPRRCAEGVLPEGPLCHRDTCTQRKNDLYYTHFPSELFEVPGVSVEQLGVTKYEFLDISIFHAKPGNMLRGNGVFNIKGNLEDGYEKRVQQSLFGALTYSRALTMDIVLDLPDIHSTWNTRILDLNPARMQEISEDEGFVDRTPSTADSLASSTCSTPQNMSALEQADKRNIWELALEHKPSRHHTWERRGKPPVMSGKPYLTEAGPEAFNRVRAMYQSHLQLLDPRLRPAPLVTISMTKLVKNIINMLIGIPSQTFELCQETFTVAEGTCVTGMSPEALAGALNELLVCGSQYVRLVRFSLPPRMDSHYIAGLVFQAFTVGIRRYLQHYQACVLSVAKTNTLLQVSALLDKVREQMRILSHLCQCDEPRPAGATPDEPDFPTGVRLLSYLYEKAFEASSSLHYPMLLSLFHTSCGPYIMFVREWVFQGNCHDIYGEFLIQINEDYLRFRDRHYWTHGYVLVSGNLNDSVPLFLRDLANDVFVCGKSINLLRLMAPKHFLLALEAETPSVSISFSEEEICSIEQQCRMYKSRMQEVARQHSKAREDMIREQDQAKQALLVKARKSAMERITKFQERAEAIKMAVDKKKRAAFAELKEHMEKDMKRRAGEKEQEKEEDAARVAATNRQELLEAAVEEDVAKKAREEMIEEYEKITAAVARREQRAIWRVARHRLEMRRIQFLAEDEDKWQAELSAKPFIFELDKTFEESMNSVSEDAEKVEDGGDPGETKSRLIPPGVDQSAQFHSPGTSLDIVNTQVTADTPTFEEPGVVSGSHSKLQHMTDESEEIEARPSVKLNSLMHATKESDTQLPQWAKDEAKTASAPFSAKESVKSRIPRWARKPLTDPSAGLDTVDCVGSDLSDRNLTDIITHDQVTGNIKTEDADVSSDGNESGEGERKRHKMTTWAASRTKMSLSQDDGLAQCAEPHVSQTTAQMNTPIENNTKQSETEFSTVPSGKKVAGRHISTETIDKQCISQQSEQIAKKLHIKMFQDRHSSVQSEPSTISKKPHIRFSEDVNATTQSEPKLRVIRRNMHGHPSQMSMISNYALITPVMQVHRKRSLFDESDFGTFLIKPRHKNANDDTPDFPRVGMNRDRSATKESVFVDYDKIKLEKFKALNVHGHASDSTVQRLLYGENFGRGRISIDLSLQEEHEDYDTEPWTEIELEEYNKDFSMLNDMPIVDLMNNIGANTVFTSWGDYEMSTHSDVSGYSYISLAALMKRSVKAPLAAQIQLVNQSLVNFFNSELEINMHFVALRRFLLLQDGEFGQSLSDELFEKLAQNLMPHEMLNPMYLNNVLSRALRSSIHGDTQYAGLVSFALKYIPTILNHHGPNALDCLELTYKVDWPVNVVITEGALSKYGSVFSFMLQLKRAVWVLKDVWHRLKRDAIINKVTTSAQSRRLQLCRHEMQHFVKVMQGYISNQVIYVTWQELQEDLTKNVHSLDDLHRCHTDYLDKCVCRCLLSKEAGPVMKIIKEIFKLILKFRKQLISHNWQQDDVAGFIHPEYDNLCHAYKIFKDYARFLFKVVSKLAMRGYQPHLQELLLRLNFNSYYSE